MEFKQDCAYDIVAPTSMGIRLTPVDHQPVELARELCLQVTSAESNVLSTAAALGLSTKVLTAIVEGSPIARRITNDLGRRNIAIDAKHVPQNGPWGYRHQINFADSGYGMRAPSVHNDRANEVGRLLRAEDFDLNRLFRQDGVKILHLSGLFVALSDETAQFSLELARAARSSGTKLSFDINYRASFWDGRNDELIHVFHELATLADVLIGNEEDFQLALGVPGPDTGGRDLNDQIATFQQMIDSMQPDYPNAAVIATTLREVTSANEHLWGAVMKSDDWHVVTPRRIPVLDRIGGGDAFVGGLLYGLLKGWDHQDACHFGWANGAYVVTLLDDFSSPMSESQIWSVWKGNARIRR